MVVINSYHNVTITIIEKYCPKLGKFNFDENVRKNEIENDCSDDTCPICVYLLVVVD